MKKCDMGWRGYKLFKWPQCYHSSTRQFILYIIHNMWLGNEIIISEIDAHDKELSKRLLR